MTKSGLKRPIHLWAERLGRWEPRSHGRLPSTFPPCGVPFFGYSRLSGRRDPSPAASSLQPSNLPRLLVCANGTRPQLSDAVPVPGTLLWATQIFLTTYGEGVGGGRSQPTFIVPEGLRLAKVR